MPINKTLPQCDCINSCGDDDRVGQGAAQPCSAYHKMLASQADHEAVRNLSCAMMSKLQDSRSKGRSGWNDKTQCSAEHLSQLLREHVEKGDPVDVANFCAFLSARGEGITPQAAPIAAAVSGGWQELAARVMDALADAQDRTNAKYPAHVKCYPSWETKPRHLRWLAEMFRTGKPIGNGAGQPDVLAALAATSATAAPDMKWRELFWAVARALNCLPSTYVDANAHVYLQAEKYAAIAIQRTPADARDAVTQAVRDYHFALDNRQHGGVAAERAIDAIQTALGLHWVQGAEASTRATIAAQGATEQGVQQ